MHWHRALKYLASSALVACASAAVVPPAPHVPIELSPAPAPVAGSVPPSEFRGSYSDIEVSCQADDEAFSLSFEVLEPENHSACGNSHLLVNGRHLNQHWSHSRGTGSTIVDNAESSVTASIHNLLLEASSDCVADQDHHSISSLPSSQRSVQVTTITVAEIDGSPAKAPCGFTVSYNPSLHNIISVIPITEHDTSLPAMTGLMKQDVEQPRPAIGDEVKRLRTLEADLQGLTEVVERQRKLVDDLAASEKHEATEELSQCDDVKCFVKTIAHKAKGCIHILIMRYGPGQEADAFSKEHDCVWPEGRAARLQVLMSGKPLCLTTHSDSDSDKSSSYSASHPPSYATSTSAFPAALPDNLSKEHKLFVFVGAILSALCLSCFAVCLHRRCCDPRRLADRAARREENNRRKQYRSLTRRKAWKDWWNFRVMRNNSGASTDYEEKRSLILAQETVLERAMQAEIRMLRAAHSGISNMASAAEEGRAYSSDDESLPAYRSRAGSGRPPSYNEYDVRIRATAYTPSNSDDTVLQQHDDTAARHDSTPDSSVANLSPRNSSETLRTERSVL